MPTESFPRFTRKMESDCELQTVQLQQSCVVFLIEEVVAGSLATAAKADNGQQQAEKNFYFEPPVSRLLS